MTVTDENISKILILEILLTKKNHHYHQQSINSHQTQATITLKISPEKRERGMQTDIYFAFMIQIYPIFLNHIVSYIVTI